ncbi:MAG: hypothetical protein AAFW66_05740, partial [Pseudomonadota bacterium]
DKRIELAKELQTVNREYEAILTEAGASKKARPDLVALYSKAQRIVSELQTVVPTAMVRDVVAELRSLPVPQARRGGVDLRTRVKGHADSIEEALKRVERTTTVLPPFPPPAGLGDGWKNIDRYWIYAVLAYGFELAVLFAWILTVLEMRSYYDSAQKEVADDATHGSPQPGPGGDFNRAPHPDHPPAPIAQNDGWHQPHPQQIGVVAQKTQGAQNG